MLTAEKRRSISQQKERSTINKSTSKALYSFSRAERFPNRNYRSVTDIRFYDVELKKYDKKVSFTSTKRTDFIKKDGIPGPTKYNPHDINNKRLSVQFKASREECKVNSVFVPNSNPGPGQYEPHYQSFKKTCYSLGKKIENKQIQGKEVPGPIYNIQSTLPDKNKYLSIYVRRSSTKIFKPQTCFSRKRKQNSELGPSSMTETLDQAVITRKGQKIIGKSGPFAVQLQSQRNFQKNQKEATPGPGHYSSFSQFVDITVQ